MKNFPYIADKKMYAAVMGACSYIREKGWFNKAVSYYSKKYGVDSDELAQHIRARQSVGQRNKHTSPKERRYFCCVHTVESGYRYTFADTVTIRKCVSAETAADAHIKDQVWGQSDNAYRFEYYIIIGDKKGYVKKEDAELIKWLFEGWRKAHPQDDIHLFKIA